MKKIFLIIIFLFFTNNLVADTLEYEGLEKLSKIKGNQKYILRSNFWPLH